MPRDDGLAGVVRVSRGVELIAAERERQVTEEGYDTAHDEGHGAQLSSAGASYAVAAMVTLREGFSPEEALEHGMKSTVPPFWPWSSHYWKPTGEPKRDLVKAGALIAAALDALEES